MIFSKCRCLSILKIPFSDCFTDFCETFTSISFEYFVFQHHNCVCVCVCVCCRANLCVVLDFLSNDVWYDTFILFEKMVWFPRQSHLTSEDLWLDWSEWKVSSVLNNFIMTCNFKEVNILSNFLSNKFFKCFVTSLGWWRG